MPFRFLKLTRSSLSSSYISLQITSLFIHLTSLWIQTGEERYWTCHPNKQDNPGRTGIEGHEDKIRTTSNNRKRTIWRQNNVERKDIDGNNDIDIYIYISSHCEFVTIWLHFLKLETFKHKRPETAFLIIVMFVDLDEKTTCYINCKNGFRSHGSFLYYDMVLHHRYGFQKQQLHQDCLIIL